VKAFQYVSFEQCDDDTQVEQSDTILKVMYMGYTVKGFGDFNFKKATQDMMTRMSSKSMRQSKYIAETSI
jgi:hypothetical protein